MSRRWSRRPTAPAICFVVHAPYPEDTRVERDARVALIEGYQVDVVAVRQPGELPQETVGGAHVYRLPLAHRRGAGIIAVLGEYFGYTVLASFYVAARNFRRRYRVIHVNSPPDFLMLAAVLPKLLGARVILDIHDFAPEMFLMRFGGLPGSAMAGRLLRRIQRLVTRFADDVVTVHQPYRQALIARGVLPSKVSVVMNSLDEALLPSAPPVRNSDQFRVVYHGTVTPLYGVVLLVDAAARVVEEIPNLQLELYGDGDALPAVRERARALALADRTTLSGRFLPHRETLRLVAGADVGVVPNLPVSMNAHALPTKLFEYVALGVPVICADLPTIREHFSEEELLFYRAGDADALAHALRAVARDPAGAAARARAALHRYQAYRWDISARRYACVLAKGGRTDLT
jgi:glycosyltransferase involved in cell wall biosynthesis